MYLVCKMQWKIFICNWKWNVSVESTVFKNTIKILNIGTLEIITVIILNFEQGGFNIPQTMHQTDVEGWMDELGFYIPSTVFQSFRDDGRVNMKGSVQWSAV